MKNKEKVLVATAWTYANSNMHIGHLACYMPSDIIARYYRKKGAQVAFVSGSDCHGTPITIRAKKEKVSPKKIAEQYHNEFSKIFEDLNFTYDEYGATFLDYHKQRVQEIFLEIEKNGYIYEKVENQDYCNKCKEFLSDREILGTCPVCGKQAKGDQCENCLTALSPSQLTDKVCGTCGEKTVTKENKHLYFKLSAFEDVIQNVLDKNKPKWRFNAINETAKYLKEGLRDRAVTRQLNWGVDVPVEGYEDKKIYVWVEAVLGYLTMLEKVALKQGFTIKDFAEDKNLKSYYVHGKDNIVFHTIIYPALLNAYNKKLALPTNIVSSEYITISGQKMSKSTGNFITVNDLIKEFEADTIRYYFTLNYPEKKDGNFTKESLVNLHNKHLVGGYGNFVNRNLAFLNKKFDGKISVGTVDSYIRARTLQAYKSVGKLIEAGEIRELSEELFNYIQLANKYYDESQPWIKVKENIEEFNNITATCIYMIANMANLLDVITPNATKKVEDMLGLTINKWEEVDTSKVKQIKDIKILFNKIDKK